MKHIINREEDAVSSIIATVILIAITIVLAATLYTALTYYATNSTISNPPPAVDISATLTEGYFYNYTITGGSPILLNNNTTFYELKINSIDGCNGNISIYNIEFIITFYNGTCCGKSLIQFSPPTYPYNISYVDRNPCSVKVECLYSLGVSLTKGRSTAEKFTLITTHPVFHMISSSFYIFIPVTVYENNMCKALAPQNHISSIEVINHVKHFVLFSVNTS